MARNDDSQMMLGNDFNCVEMAENGDVRMILDCSIRLVWISAPVLSL